MNNQLPADLMEQIELKAVHEAALQFHPVYSPDQNTACRICYRNGAKEYAEWKVKHDELNDKVNDLENEIESTGTLILENERLKERCEKMEAALEWIKTYGPDQSATGQAFIEKALKEGESNTPDRGEGEKEVDNV